MQTWVPWMDTFPNGRLLFIRGVGIAASGAMYCDDCPISESLAGRRVVQLFWCDIECRPLSVGTPEQDACFVAWSYQSNSPRLLRILAYDVCNTHFIWYWVTDWSFMPIHYSRLFHLIFVYLWDNFSSQKQTDTHMYLWQECAALLCREISFSRSLAIFSALFQIARDTDKCESSALIVHNRFNNSFHYIT